MLLSRDKIPRFEALLRAAECDAVTFCHRPCETHEKVSVLAYKSECGKQRSEGGDFDVINLTYVVAIGFLLGGIAGLL